MNRSEKELEAARFALGTIGIDVSKVTLDNLDEVMAIMSGDPIPVALTMGDWVGIQIVLEEIVLPNATNDLMREDVRSYIAKIKEQSDPQAMSIDEVTREIREFLG